MAKGIANYNPDNGRHRELRRMAEQTTTAAAVNDVMWHGGLPVHKIERAQMALLSTLWQNADLSTREQAIIDADVGIIDGRY